MTATIVVTPIELDGTEVELFGDSYHHLFRVRRLRAGESVRVVDGEGRARRGVIARVDRARGMVALAGPEPALEPALRLELLVAPPKPERAAWLVEKATEVGVAAIRLVATERGARAERVFGHAQLARLSRIAVAAVEQCGRAVVPEVTGLHELAEVISPLRRDARSIVVLDASGASAPPDVAPFLGSSGFSILIGPEGGWSEEEIALFGRSGLARWSLGERVLRVETAALVAAGILLAGARSADVPEAGSR
jgi:16S rRNA (uracil1498-N3)-methyltransferase